MTGIFVLALFILAAAAFSWNHESVFFGGQAYYTDGDCYARMTRVRQLQQAPFTSIRTHSFENYPDGTHPHTTAPLDILIALLAMPLRPFASQPLALAGALISPLLGLLTFFALAVWASLFRLSFRSAMLFLFAVSPIMTQGFLLGRPDHQSLILFLVSLALAAEAAIWHGRSAKWSYLSAVAWALALWVSLFEPLILLAIVLLARGARALFIRREGDAHGEKAGAVRDAENRGHGRPARESCLSEMLDAQTGEAPVPPEQAGSDTPSVANGAKLGERRSGILPLSSGKSKRQDAASTFQTAPILVTFRSAAKRLSIGPLAVFVGILVFAWAWDGWRAAAFDPHFDAWAKNIGELRHGTPEIIFSWTGWLLAICPLLLAWRFWKSRDPLCLLWIVLILIAAGLTVEYLRWGYFLALFFAMAIPWMLPAIQWKWLAWLAFAISLWPVAGEWERMLYPDDEAFRARAEGVADAVCLRDAALSLRGKPEHGVVAPWWFCPAVVWWSGQPCLGGTSHQSLPGIADSSEVFLATDISKAKAILARRKAGYLLAYEPERVVSNSAQILAVPVPAGTLAEGLYKNPAGYSGDFKLIHRNRFFRVYEILPPQDPAGVDRRRADVPSAKS